MIKYVDNIIRYSFYFLFFSIPLILSSRTSEIFEFNKIILVYLFTIIIVGAWLIKRILNPNLVFRRTFIDIFLLLFLTAMTASVYYSVDPHTSLLGYYSRFNGGLLSLVSYCLLYWAYVSNMDRKDTETTIRVLMISSLISATWAIFEHFGHSFSCLIFTEYGVFDNSCWVQDVQARVYSTFGQPNWLASWITALIPLTWISYEIFNFHNKVGFTFSIFSKFLKSKFKILDYYLQYLPSVICHLCTIVFFITLLFTKSRSGILAFVISYLIFWGYYLLFFNENVKRKILRFGLVTFCLLLITLVIGTPWSPKLGQAQNTKVIIASPSLETGGTESGEIRKIVWQGAVDIWKNYPLFGSGLETFALTYYNFRPASHNLTSEWDYLYNKAHNEYLNFAATTGTVGLLAYILLICASLFVFVKNIQTQTDHKNIVFQLSLLSGYVAILITNFFGFSTVPINVLFFLFPAFSVTSGMKLDKSGKLRLEAEVYYKHPSKVQAVLIAFVLLITYHLLLTTYHYWSWDHTYAQARRLNALGNHQEAVDLLTNLVGKNPYEPIFWDELSDASANLALQHSESYEEQIAKSFAQSSYLELKTATDLSPSSVTLKRKAATRLITLSGIDPNYLNEAKYMLIEAVKLAPTDAKLRYNLALAYLRTGETDKAVEAIKTTIELKHDYELAHYALALIYVDQGNVDGARHELKYILEKINPNNQSVKRELDELK